MSDPSVFLICNSAKSTMVGRLMNAAHQLGVQFGHAQFGDIRLTASGGSFRFDTGPDTAELTGHSHYVMTGALGGTHHVKNALITTLRDSAVVLNKSALEQNIGGMNKLVQLVRLAKAGVPVIPTTQANGEPAFQEAIAERHARGVAAFVKPISGTGGSGCQVIRTEDLDNAIAELNPRQTLVQDYMPIKHDYRVLILNDRVLGVMKREIVDGEVVSNVAKGSATSMATIGEDALNAALLAVQTMGLEFAGVDVLIHDGKPYVIEVNSQPNFSGFEDATGVDVAKALLSYLVSIPVPTPFAPTNWAPFAL